MSQFVLHYRLDLVALLFVGVVGVAWANAWLRRRFAGHGVAARYRWSLIALLFVTAAAAEGDAFRPRQVRDDTAAAHVASPSQELARRGLTIGVGLALAVVMLSGGVADARRAAVLDHRAAATAEMSRRLAELSHELRSPMAAIRGYCEYLQAEAADDLRPEHRDALAAIRRQGDYLLTLADDMLDWSRAEAGLVRIERQPVATAELLRDMREMMRMQAAPTNLSFGVEFARPIPATIVTDPIRLRQILVNLLSNAFKFTTAGGVRLLVDVAEANDRGDAEAKLKFIVVDTGIGIADHEITGVFQPFRQSGSGMPARRGAGLGLAISKRLAELLGGDITVGSTPGAGSTFTAAVAAGDIDGVPRISSIDAPPQSPDRGGADVDRSRIELAGRVLVVDDCHDFRRLMTLILTNSGLEVATAEDGRGALDEVAAARESGRPFNLVIADVQMPGLDGRRLAATLQQRGEGVSVIACSAHADQSEREQCLAAGCTDYLLKPIDPETLLRQVSRSLQTPRHRETAAV